MANQLASFLFIASSRCLSRRSADSVRRALRYVDIPVIVVADRNTWMSCSSGSSSILICHPIASSAFVVVADSLVNSITITTVDVEMAVVNVIGKTVIESNCLGECVLNIDSLFFGLNSRERHD